MTRAGLIDGLDKLRTRSDLVPADRSLIQLAALMLAEDGMLVRDLNDDYDVAHSTPIVLRERLRRAARS